MSGIHSKHLLLFITSPSKENSKLKIWVCTKYGTRDTGIYRDIFIFKEDIFVYMFKEDVFIFNNIGGFNYWMNLVNFLFWCNLSHDKIWQETSIPQKKKKSDNDIKPIHNISFLKFMSVPHHDNWVRKAQPINSLQRWQCRGFGKWSISRSHDQWVDPKGPGPSFLSPSLLLYSLYQTGKRGIFRDWVTGTFHLYVPNCSPFLK